MLGDGNKGCKIYVIFKIVKRKIAFLWRHNAKEPFKNGASKDKKKGFENPIIPSENYLINVETPLYRAITLFHPILR